MPMDVSTKMPKYRAQPRLFVVGMTAGLISLSGCQHIQVTKSPMPVVVHTREKSPPKPEAASADALPTKNRPTPTTIQQPNTIFILEDWF